MTDRASVLSCAVLLALSGAAPGGEAEQVLESFRPPSVKREAFGEWTRRQWSAANRHCEKLAEQVPGLPLTVKAHWQATLERARRVAAVWDALDNATHHREDEDEGWDDLPTLGDELLRLQALLGPGFAHGWRGMPPPVPFWACLERD
jgi:hypothetical protein